MDVTTPLVADRQAPVLAQPRQHPLDDSAVPAQPLTRLDALAGHLDADAASPQEPATARDFVCLVGMQFDGPLARSSAGPPDRPDGINGLLERGAIMPVRAGERRAAPVGYHMALGIRLAAIRRIRSGR